MERSHPEGPQGADAVELNVHLDPELLRGVSLSEALSGCGRHWKTPDTGMFGVDPAHYQLSKETEGYDAFLSHDWASSGLLKLLSLLIVFNSGPAFFTCLAISIAAGFLRGYKIIPDMPFDMSVGSSEAHFGFVLVFLFWQRVRSLTCRPLVVFLDKLCIAQHDEELKQRGIVSLPGFLMSSRELVVLWSPRYFSRLWCTFEIATFLKDAGNERR